MTFPHSQRILQQLWPTPDDDERAGAEREPDSAPEPQTFVILDGARDVSIYESVLNSGLEYRCLYMGEIPLALAKVAPYLVRLEPDDPFNKLLVENTWGRNWGIYLVSGVSINVLRRHFRRFLKVHDEDGATLYFRYYDPRVFRVYLPTCNETELAFIFGPVDRFMMEDEDRNKLLDFYLEEARLRAQSISLEPAPEPVAPALPRVVGQVPEVEDFPLGNPLDDGTLIQGEDELFAELGLAPAPEPAAEDPDGDPNQD